MILTLQILNTDASLNSFFDIGSAKFIPKHPLKIKMRILQSERTLRYIPDSAATLSMEFRLSDGTTVNKNPTFLDASDRSLLEVELTAAETELLIGQTLSVEINEGGNLSIARLQMGLSAFKAGGC